MAKKVRNPCTAKTVAGKPCKSWRVDGLATCIAHSPDRAERGFRAPTVGNPIPGGGGVRKPRAVDILKTRLEQRADEVLDTYFAALIADKGIAVGGSSRDAYVEFVADHPTRLRAADALLDRVYGKAKQTTEISGPEGGAIPVSVPQTAGRAADVAAILARAGALPSAAGVKPHEGRQRRSPGTPASEKNGMKPMSGNGSGHG